MAKSPVRLNHAMLMPLCIGNVVFASSLNLFCSSMLLSPSQSNQRYCSLQKIRHNYIISPNSTHFSSNPRRSLSTISPRPETLIRSRQASGQYTASAVPGGSRAGPFAEIRGWGLALIVCQAFVGDHRGSPVYGFRVKGLGFRGLGFVAGLGSCLILLGFGMSYRADSVFKVCLVYGGS